MTTVLGPVGPLQVGDSVEAELQALVSRSSTTVTVTKLSNTLVAVTKEAETIARMRLGADDVRILDIRAASQLDVPLAGLADGVAVPLSALETVLGVVRLGEIIATDEFGYVLTTVSVVATTQRYIVGGQRLPLASYYIVTDRSRESFFEQYGFAAAGAVDVADRAGLEVADLGRLARAERDQLAARPTTSAIRFVRDSLGTPTAESLFRKFEALVYPRRPLVFSKEVLSTPPPSPPPTPPPPPGSDYGILVVKMPSFDNSDYKTDDAASPFYGPAAEGHQYVLLARANHIEPPTMKREARALAAVMGWQVSPPAPLFIKEADLQLADLIDPAGSSRKTVWWPALGRYNGNPSPGNRRLLWANDDPIDTDFGEIDRTAVSDAQGQDPIQWVPVGCTCRDWAYRGLSSIDSCKHMWAYHLYTAAPM